MSEHSSGTVNLDYTLPVQMYIDIGFYDLSGRLIATAYDGLTEPGEHTSSVEDLPSGIYTARISAGDMQSTERFTVLR